MKKLVASTVLLVLISFGLNAQSGTSYGIKGGLNYNANGNYFESINSNAQHPDRAVGYHIGFFGKLSLGDLLYFRPELMYTSTKSEYDSDDFSMQKIDAPLLIGTRIIGPISVFAGPSLQYIVNTKFAGIKIDNVKEDFTVGLNFGVSADLGRLGIDLRYERGFSKNEARFINNNIGAGVESRIATRPDQLILSLSVAL